MYAHLFNDDGECIVAPVVDSFAGGACTGDSVKRRLCSLVRSVRVEGRSAIRTVFMMHAVPPTLHSLFTPALFPNYSENPTFYLISKSVKP